MDVALEKTSAFGICQQAILGIVGAGGFGREVAAFATAIHNNCAFVQSGRPERDEINGLPWCSVDRFISEHASKNYVIAIASSTVRERLANELDASGCVAFTLIAPNAHIGTHGIEIGLGSIICPFASITTDAKIGRHFHGNIYSYVAHDCVIGDFVTFAPMVCCNGNVHIGDHAYIGTGAKILQGKPGKPIRVGRAAVVGMGAVVIEDVPDGATVVGCPAKRVR